ncbi:serine/arginine-rich splicing factor RSZ22A-like [Sturnira hondurensis]|uniref:serine/arginine-rich splicing factor RSZ22A-like n=1 Tax=Sturnira hondurensis TaxID=192404 RepID=UPI0018798032|nr:serine/arginine-rich splicing factor RSZ22A-like [Sturnira hondurensis]
MGEGAGGPRSGRGRGGGRGEARRPEGRGGAGGGEGGEGRGEGRGREGAGGKRSSRVTSPTRRRGHRRSRRHFNRAFGLRSALSVWAKEPKRSASRSHSSASRPLFASRPPAAHTPHAPHRRGPLAALPFLFRPASPPSVHPLSVLAHPAQPGSQSAAGRETRSQRGRGGSPVLSHHHLAMQGPPSWNLPFCRLKLML